MITPKDLLILSSSQRRYACIALQIPYSGRQVDDVLLDIVLKCTEERINLDLLHTMIDLTRETSQARSDQINPDYLVVHDPAKVTLNALLQHFTNHQLTQLAYKMRLPRAFGSRLLIAQHIEDLAQRHHLTMAHIDILFARKHRLPQHLDDIPGSHKWEVLG